jgi:hypothetical protein
MMRRIVRVEVSGFCEASLGHLTAQRQMGE